ncbi:MAG: hypothetical protein LBT10_09660 [Methanobrevibacter sp.]|jgi:hypothetical protein|nr:hypothetical protein [Methanobrevibacter sp.]
MTNVLDTKLSMAEYVHILDVIQNKSLQTEGADFYMAYISKPDEVFINPYINDTPKNLINKIPYYKSTVISWDRIITSYGRMDYHDRIMYLNTIGLDSDSVVNLYKTSDINTVVYMLNQSSIELNELDSVDFNKSSTYWIGHIGEAKSKGNQISSIMEKFNNKSVFAYNEYTYGYVDHDSVFLDNNVINTTWEQLNGEIDTLMSIDDKIYGNSATLYLSASVVTSFGVMMVAFGSVNVDIVAIVIGILLLAIGMVLLSLAGCLSTVDVILMDNINLLKSDRDSLPH